MKTKPKKTSFIIILSLAALMIVQCGSESLLGSTGAAPSVVHMATDPVVLQNNVQNSGLIQLTNKTNGSIIIYTTDGSNPKTSNNANAIIPPKHVQVFNGIVIKAYSKKAGYLDSNIITYKYSSNQGPKVVKPLITINNPNNQGPFWVIRIESKTSGSYIKYTSDGSNPLTSITAQSGKSPKVFNVQKGKAIKAYAYKNGMKDSGIVTEILPN